MACEQCGKESDGNSTPAVQSWTVIPLIDLENVPDDLDFICGSDKELKSWRIPMSYLLDRIKKLEEEIQELKNGK